MTEAEPPAEWQRVVSKHEGIPSYDVFTLPIEKPETDEREYRVIKLRNGLKATLVHDARATKAAATLNVAVGHLADPDDIPSLTLLCYRLLYLGTKEFPKETDFIDNQGEFDAETDGSNTTYHCSVASAQLSEALSRFSALFHCPLFPIERVKQQLKAMINERADQPLDATLRVLTVLKHLSKNGHVLRQPKAENALEKVRKLANNPGASADELCEDPAVLQEIRRRLVGWWEREYCSSRMDLCVVGKDTLDELAEFVVARFAPIRKRNVDPLPTIKDHPIGPEEIGQLVMIQAGADIPQLQMTFALDSQMGLWRHKPGLLFSLIVEQKRHGSLHSYLESQHWITALRCAPRSVARGIDTLELTVDLTDEGFLKFRSVILAISDFFSFLRSKSPLDAYHQRDCATLMSNGFRFSDYHPPQAHAQFIAESMQRPYPPELLLAAPRSNWEWGDEYKAQNGDVIGDGEEGKFQSYVKMATLENARVILSAKKEDFDRLDAVVGFGKEDRTWEAEPVRNTQFRKHKFDDEFIAEASRMREYDEFSLPGPNEFLPTKFYRDKQVLDAKPEKVNENALLTVWRMRTDVLKTAVIVNIRSPAASGTLRKVVLNMFFGKIVQDALVGTAYSAFLAGHQYTILPTSNGVTFSFYGYIDKLPLLIERVLDGTRNLTVDEKKLEETTQLMRAVTLSRLLRPPRALSDEFLLYLMAESDWTVQEIAREVDVPITPQEILDFRNDLVSHARILMFVHGNAPDDEITKVADVVEKGFGSAEQTFTNLESKSLLLPPGCNFIRTEKVINPDERQSALTYYLQLGPITDRHKDATALVLSRLLYMSLANALAEVGHEVRCELLNMHGKGQQGIIISVQSDRTPDILELYLESILSDVRGFLDMLEDESIRDLKQASKGGWDTVPKNPADASTLYDLHLLNGTLDYDFGKFSEEALKKVGISDVRMLFMGCVHPASKIRSKLSIHTVSQNPIPIKRVSDDAAAAFKAVLEQQAEKLNLNVSETWKEAHDTLGPNPTFSQFHRFWASVLNEDKDEYEVILNLIPTLIERHPAVGNEGPQKIQGATYIEKVDEFKHVLYDEVEHDSPQFRLNTNAQAIQEE
ncbi:metalloprotease [Marasmius crinis-equi]|uniref:Metalloprotease n=1 Tax=Marasmius crinis-equi TaxID=585013 RepID=A0ABR3FIK4_9AGAR